MRKLAIVAIALLAVFLLAGCIGAETGGGTGGTTSGTSSINEQIDNLLNQINETGTDLNNLLNP